MPIRPERVEAPAFGMMTIFDEIADSHSIPLDLTSGTHESFVIYDGVSRGIAVLARCTWRKALLGFKVDPHDGDIEVTVNVTLDEVTHSWWLRKHDDRDRVDSQHVRHVFIRAQGDIVGGFTVAGESQQVSHTFVMRGDLVPPGGLLMLELLGFQDHAFVGPTNEEPLQGLQLDSIQIRPARSGPGPQVYVDADRRDGRSTPQGCVVTRDQPITLRFRVLEQPPLREGLRTSSTGRAVARGLRKAGVVRRAAMRRSGRFSRDSDAVSSAFRVDAFCPDGSSEDVAVALLDDDIVELTFPPSDGAVAFFELGVREPHLARLGYAERVVFEHVPH